MNAMGENPKGQQTRNHFMGVEHFHFSPRAVG